MIIDKEIRRAQTLHTELLKEAAGFTKEYDRVLGVRRKAIFTERFNFQGEFDKLMTKRQSLETLKFLFEPLLTPKLRKSFNPLRIFEPQRLVKNRRDDQESQLEDVNAERVTIDDLTRTRVRRNFIFYAARLLELLAPPPHQIYLQDFCAKLVEKYAENSVYNGDFISFIMEMNRDKKIGEYSRVIDFSSGKLPMDQELKTIEEVFVKATLAAQAGGKMYAVIVNSFPDEEVELLPGLKITNMLFTGERKS
jgi:hypothetical protein